MIKEKIGIDTFKQSLKIILTDRGVEFYNPKDIEFNSETGELLTRIFYCDSRQSQQKGKIEKNHKELRKICQKGFDFNTITQTKLNLALNHVNSYPRKFLNCKSPINLFKIYAPDIMLTLNDSKLIPIDKVNLKPNLFN